MSGETGVSEIKSFADIFSFEFFMTVVSGLFALYIVMSVFFLNSKETVASNV